MENSPMLISRGLTTVLSDLAQIGYNSKWIILGASDLGYNHKRKRIWILATQNSSDSDYLWKQQQKGSKCNKRRWNNNSFKGNHFYYQFQWPQTEKGVQYHQKK